MTSGARFPSPSGASGCLSASPSVPVLTPCLFARQLEAIIRISESIAKITLTPVVLPHHVDEAIRLFKYSTMDAVSAGSVEGLTRGELNEEVERIEREVRRRLPIGWSTSYGSLVKEFVTSQGYTQHALERTLFIMEKREVIRFSGQVRPALRSCCWTLR